LYEKGLVFRHDYEAVFGAILDFAVERAEVDRERIVLSGRSFGGYLAPRAACFERRARAVIADPGQYDLRGSGPEHAAATVVGASGGIGARGRGEVCRDAGVSLLSLCYPNPR
jgi:dienelactone hydrolase